MFITVDLPVLLTQLDPLTLTSSHPAFDICKLADSVNNSCYELKTNITIDSLIDDSIIDAGPWDIKVTNNFDGRSDTKVLAFKITKEMGAISGIKDLRVCTSSADCPGNPLVSDCPLSDSVCDITLIWTSPPSAATFDPRYSETAISTDGSNWSLATQVPGSPFMASSSPPLVIKLQNNKVWILGIMSSDLAFKSSLSNIISFTVGDLNPPDAVNDLSAQAAPANEGEHTIDLSWTAVFDPPDGATVKKYEIRYASEEPTVSGELTNFSTFVYEVPTPGSVVAGTTVLNAKITGLSGNTLYYLDIKGADDATNKALTNSATYGCPGDTTSISSCAKTKYFPPADITDLRSFYETVIQSSDDGSFDSPNAGGFNSGNFSDTIVTGTGENASVGLLPLANTINLFPLMDAYISYSRTYHSGWGEYYSAPNNLNFGGSINLEVGKRNKYDATSSYIKFDTSPITSLGLLPSDILDARLGLNVTYADSTRMGSAVNYILQLNKITSSWGEFTITSNNQPSYDSAILSFMTINNRATGWAYSDTNISTLTLVRDWIQNPILDFGVRVQRSSPGFNKAYLNFSSRENPTDPLLAPKMEVTINNPIFKGTFESATIDLKRNSNFFNVSWDRNQPVNTSVNILLATANSLGGPWTYVGPGGSSPASDADVFNGTFTDIFTNASGEVITSSRVLNGKRYLRYKVYIKRQSLADGNPTLNDISFVTDGEIISSNETSILFTTDTDFNKGTLTNVTTYSSGNTDIILAYEPSTACDIAKCGDGSDGVLDDSTTLPVGLLGYVPVSSASNSPCFSGDNYAYCINTSSSADGIYQFSSVNITKKVGVYGSNPLIIKSTGNVTISGTLDGNGRTNVQVAGPGGSAGMSGLFGKSGGGKTLYGDVGTIGGGGSCENTWNTAYPELDIAGGGGFGGAGGYAICPSNKRGAGVGGRSYNTDLSTFPLNTGGSASGRGTASGGMINIVSGTLISIDGSIMVNGAAGSYKGGGSGGAIGLAAPNVINNNYVSANGGSAIGFSGGGGGGIIRTDGILSGSGTFNVKGGAAETSQISLRGPTFGTNGVVYKFNKYKPSGNYTSNIFDIGNGIIGSLVWNTNGPVNTSLSIDIQAANLLSGLDCSTGTVDWAAGSGWQSISSASFDGKNELTTISQTLLNKRCIQFRANLSSSDIKVTPRLNDFIITIKRTSDRSIYLTWTAPGDNGSIGQAASYDLRVSKDPILNATDFSNAGILTGLPTPSPVGGTETYIVSSGAGERLDKLVGLWHLDGTGAVVLNDAIPAIVGSDGVASSVGTMSYNPGKRGESISFDGLSDQITGSLPVTLNTEITLEAWFKSPGGGEGMPRLVEISTDGSAATSSAVAYNTDGSLRAWVSCQGGFRAGEVDSSTVENYIITTNGIMLRTLIMGHGEGYM